MSLYSELNKVLPSYAERIKGNTAGIKTLKDNVDNTTYTKKLSDGIIHFEDGADGVDLNEFIVNVTYQQSGSGDPSLENIRPFSGWPGCSVFTCGENLYNTSLNEEVVTVNRNATYEISDGIMAITPQLNAGNNSGVYATTAKSRICKVLTAIYRLGYTITVSFDMKASVAMNARYGVPGYLTEIALTTEWQRITYVIPDTSPNNFVWYANVATEEGSIMYVKDIMISVDGNTTFVEGKGRLTTPVWSSIGDVFGALFNVLTGDLIVTKGHIDSYAGETLPGQWASSMDVYSEGSSPTNGSEVVYDLAEPITYSPVNGLTVTTFAGVNNIFVHTGSVDSLIYKSDMSTVIDEIKQNFEVVDTHADILDSTADLVLVTSNNNGYGDGGPCLFEVRDGETRRTIRRNNGTYVAASPNQGVLFESNPDYDYIMRIASGYVGNSNLVYGNDETLFDATVGNQLDCSSFVSAVIQGITYNKSKYIETNTQNTRDENAGYILPNGEVRIGGLKAAEMAIYFAQHKNFFTFPSDRYKAISLLRFGDILYMGSDLDEYKHIYHQIDHIVLVMGVFPVSGVISIMQCGGGGTGNNETTACKTSYIRVGFDSNYPLSRLKAFTRPIWTLRRDYEGSDIVHAVFGGSYTYKLRLIPNSFTNNVSGEFSWSPSQWSDPRYLPVYPGKTLTVARGESSLMVRCALYDKDHVFLGYHDIVPGLTVPENAAYMRVNVGYTNASGKKMTLALALSTLITMS